MAPEAAASVLAGMLLTLAGVHGDVRPENVLVDASGGLTVTGFGASPAFDPAEPAYLAPEVLAGAPPTAAADVFAATAVFFECLTDEPPFRAATPEDLNALHEYTQIIAEFAPKELQPLIQRGLSADPAQRPESAHEFLAEVEATASEAYGPDWRTRGRDLLAAWARAAATVDGAELAAPAEMPAKIPSSLASRCVIASASSSPMVSSWSTFSGVQWGMTPPVQPWIKNGPRSPPLIAGELSGSCAWMKTPRDFRASDTPISDPAVPRPWQKAVTRPRVCSQISRPRCSRWCSIG